MLLGNTRRGRKVSGMTSKKDFTADEWKILSDAPLFVGGAVAAAAPSGLVGTVKESMALINSMTSAAQHHPNNQLIQEVVPKGVSREQLDTWSSTARGLIQQSEAARVEQQGIEMCQRCAMILQHKGDPQETDEYKRWLLEVGENVARAANEGGNMFNMGGVKFSPQEAQILSVMSSALGVTYIPTPPNPENYLRP
jgi:hypothetical protein